MERRKGERKRKPNMMRKETEETKDEEKERKEVRGRYLQFN